MLIFSSLFTFAEENDQLKQDRDAFLRIEKQIWRKTDDEFAKLIQSLNTYPLVPYLLERKILHNLRAKKAPQVRDFLKYYQNTVSEKRLLRPWLRHLARYNRKTLFLEFYRPIGDVKLECKFLRYQIQNYNQGLPSIEQQEIFDRVSTLWLVGKSQPKECDPAFKYWKSENQLTSDLVLQRIEKSARGGQHTLIPYLKTLLPAKQKYLADLWLSVRRSPSNIQYLNRLKGRYPKIEAELASYALGRLIWRDTELALNTAKRAETSLTFDQQQWGYVANRFAVKLAIDDHPSAEYWAVKAESLARDPEVLRWHMADLLRDKDWSSLINLISKSAPDLTSENQYQYWLARAYEQTGNTEKASELYKQLAQERHYYGFLSSARIGQPVNLQNQPITPEPSTVNALLANDSAKKAYELFKLKRYHEARLEWRHFQSQLSEQELLVASVIASNWGWHDQAILGFSRNGYLDDVHRRFPIAYEDIIIKEATRNKVDPEWAFAIARRESSFMPDAVSSADARGLMQLLPSTARYLEKKRVSSRQLLNPNINAKLGNKYLRYLLNKLDDNTVLATASYNAGWRRVKNWLPQDEAIDADLWIETIPFKETRNYVKAVMAYKQIYQERLNNPQAESVKSHQSVFNEMVGMTIPVSI